MSSSPKASSAKYSIHEMDLGKPNDEVEEMMKRSKKEGHLRVFAKEDADKAMAAENPFEKITANYYEQRVREIRAKTFAPPIVPRWSIAARHYATFFEDRLKANCEKLATCKEAGLANVPFLYKCPHPTTEEMEAFQNSWDNEGGAYKAAIKAAMKIRPDFTWGFLPHIVFGVESHSTVMISVIIVGHPEKAEPAASMLKTEMKDRAV
mgnify:CR=1 FL=1